VDTLRRWDKQGRIATQRDEWNRRIVPAAEIDRLRGEPSSAGLSARNRIRGTVTDVKIEGLIAQVEIVTASEPIRLVAIVTRDAVEDLGLKAGMAATAIVKSTSVMVQQ
jgi:molybdopterin-binding protein